MSLILLCCKLFSPNSCLVVKLLWESGHGSFIFTFNKAWTSVLLEAPLNKVKVLSFATQKKCELEVKKPHFVLRKPHVENGSWIADISLIHCCIAKVYIDANNFFFQCLHVEDLQWNAHDTISFLLRPFNLPGREKSRVSLNVGRTLHR